MKHRYYWIAQGPWAVNVFDVDRSACWNPLPLKGFHGAVGRQLTSRLISGYADTLRRAGVSPGNIAAERVVAGGVNGDFFSFSPPGVPAGPHITHERLIAGAADRNVFAVDSIGGLFIGRLPMRTIMHFRGDSVEIAWNRPSRAHVALLDGGFPERTDTATGALEFVLRGFHFPENGRPEHVQRLSPRFLLIVDSVDTLPEGVDKPDGVAIIVGAQVDATIRAKVARLTKGDTVFVTHRFPGFRPLHAIAGRPVLLRGGRMAPETETVGDAGFRGRHPRTAVGFDSTQRRLLLITVDGRQPRYSAGMTLPEIASLMQSLGATEALNLDGGGSTTFVVVDSADHSRFRIANRPSDKEGERPVANALAIENSCGMWMRHHDRNNNLMRTR